MKRYLRLVVQHPDTIHMYCIGYHYCAIVSIYFHGTDSKHALGRAGKKGTISGFFPTFFLLGAKNIFADLHVSGNSKTFLPL
jgi:hypothetical protein